MCNKLTWLIQNVSVCYSIYFLNRKKIGISLAYGLSRAEAQIFGQIMEKSNWTRIETILHIVLRFQLNRACFQIEASLNFSVSNNLISLSSADTNISLRLRFISLNIN